MTDLRTIERDSIRAFVQRAADEGYLSGRVLDYGCGKQPYRGIVEAASGEYVGYDAPSFPASVASSDTTGQAFGQEFDAILCTQVVQYVPGVTDFFWKLRERRRLNKAPKGHVLTPGNQPPFHLVLTYPTNWPEVEPEDLHRFTKAGMERLLTEAGFEIVLHEKRQSFSDAKIITFDNRSHRTGPGDLFALGYGVVARA